MSKSVANCPHTSLLESSVYHACFTTLPPWRNLVVKRSPVLIALIGVGLLTLGAALTYLSSRRYSEQHVVANAGTCRLEMNVIQVAGLPENSQGGSVILFHGLAANKVIMTFLARAFAEQGLRVYVPDLPGHGRTPGPFSPDEAEACAQSFVRGLTARGFIRPDRTILAGHSMGGAIALRVAAKVRVAGVVAISPAPMKTDHGVTPEALLYRNPPPVPPNSLILAGQLEPEGLRANAADLAASQQRPHHKIHSFPVQLARQHHFLARRRATGATVGSAGIAPATDSESCRGGEICWADSLVWPEFC